jgi:zinc protease
VRPRRYPVHRLLPAALAAGLAGWVHAAEAPPPPGPPRPVRFPTPVERRFTNGLRVIVVARHEVPLGAAQLIVKAGSEADPLAKPGLARLTADLLTQGTTHRTALQIAQAVDTLGADLDASARWDASRASVSATTPKFGAALEILADVVQHPTFAQSEIDRKKTQALSDLQVSYHNPMDLARMVTPRVLYGDGAYGHPLEGTPQSLRSMTRGALVSFHKAHYRPDNAILILGGDMEPAAALVAARRTFGGWKASAGSRNRPRTVSSSVGEGGPPTSRSRPGRVVVIDKPDAGRAAVVVGRVAIPRASPDYYHGLVANSVLSGYSGRLNREVRIKRGLSYGAGSSLDPRRSAGPFVASSLVDNAKAAEGAAVIMDTIAGLEKEPVEPAELGTRKATVIGEFSRDTETIGGLIGQIGSLALYTIPLAELNRTIPKVETVTPAQVGQFARRWMAPDDSLVIVGNTKLFLDDLRRRFSNVELIPFTQLDLNRADLRKGRANRR